MRSPLFYCFILGILITYLRLGDLMVEPSHVILGGWHHPDNLGNHWLLVWVAEQLSQGKSIMHNDMYYIPVGDAPWLAGNGSEGMWFLPFYLMFGWPLGAGLMTCLLHTLVTYAGYRLAYQLGIQKWSALLAGCTISCSTYLFRELNAGRITQANIVFLLLALGSFAALLRAPKRSNLISTGIWTALCDSRTGSPKSCYQKYGSQFCADQGLDEHP